MQSLTSLSLVARYDYTRDPEPKIVPMIVGQSVLLSVQVRVVVTPSPIRRIPP